MAKTEGSLFSLGAHGSIGKTLTFSKRKSGQQARRYNKPLKDPSAKQRGQRRLTEFLVAQWQNMSDADKATWDASARVTGLNIAGYHYFLREAQRDLYTHHGLAGYWHCNEIVDGKVLDLSGNANHGTLNPSYPANAPTLVTSQRTKFGKALQYDGVDEYVDIGQRPTLDITNNLSIEILLKNTTFISGRQILNKATWDNHGYIIRQLSGNRTEVSVHNIAWGQTSQTIALETPSTTAFYSITMTWASGWLRAYLDGQLIEEEDNGESAIGNPSAQNCYFAKFFANYTAMVLDEVCFYNRLLSTAEIATRYKFALRGVS